MNVVAFPIKPQPRRIGPGTPPHKRKHKTVTGAMNSAARKIALAKPDFDGENKLLFEAANRWLADHQIEPLQGDNVREALRGRVALMKPSDYAHLILNGLVHAVECIDLQNEALVFHDHLFETDAKYRALMSTNSATAINVYVNFDRVKAAKILIKAATRGGNMRIATEYPGLVMNAVRDGLRERRALAKKLASKVEAA